VHHHSGGARISGWGSWWYLLGHCHCQLVWLMAAIIGGQKGNFLWVLLWQSEYCTILGVRFCWNGGEGLGNQSHIFFGDRGIGSSYVKGREVVTSSHGGHHGEDGAGGFSTVFSHGLQYQESFWVISQKSGVHVVCLSTLGFWVGREWAMVSLVAVIIVGAIITSGGVVLIVVCVALV